MQRGFDPHHFLAGLGAHLRNLLVSKDASTTKLIEGTDDLRTQFANQAARCSLHFLVRAMQLVNEAERAGSTKAKQVFVDAVKRSQK